MSWLKSPWFWILLILAVILAWLVFFRSPAGRSSVAPTSLGNRSTVGGWGGLIDAIVSKFSVGDSIMTSGGSG